MKTICLFILLASFHVLNGDILTCDDQPKDIVFILDSSESIDPQSFNFAKTAIIKIIEGLKISKDDSRVALEQFGSDASITFNLDTYSDKQKLINAVQTAEYTHGLTAIGKALNLTLSDILPKMRPDVLKLVILVTDGMNNIFPKPQSFAEKIKASNVTIVCFGIGSQINKEELTLIASENLVIILNNFQELISDLQQLFSRFCRYIDPVPREQCTQSQQDLVFLIDSSDSISADDYEHSKTFIKKVIQELNLNPDFSRVAMISFSESVRLDFDIDQYNTESEYNSAIDKAKKFGSATAIGKALNEALTAIYPKRRSSVPFNIILVTDGRNNVFPKPIIPATDLKNKGVNIVSVAVGKDVDMSELQSLSSNNNVVKVDNYEELTKGIASVQKVITCEIPFPTKYGTDNKNLQAQSAVV